MYRRGPTGQVLEQLRERHSHWGDLDRKVWDDRATLLRSTARPIIQYVTARFAARIAGQNVPASGPKSQLDE
jgi:hypothetical protein